LGLRQDGDTEVRQEKTDWSIDRSLVFLVGYVIPQIPCSPQQQEEVKANRDVCSVSEGEIPNLAHHVHAAGPQPMQVHLTVA
jgi:hypothetical protein